MAAHAPFSSYVEQPQRAVGRSSVHMRSAHWYAGWTSSCSPGHSGQGRPRLHRHQRGGGGQKHVRPVRDPRGRVRGGRRNCFGHTGGESVSCRARAPDALTCRRGSRHAGRVGRREPGRTGGGLRARPARGRGARGERQHAVGGLARARHAVCKEICVCRRRSDPNRKLSVRRARAESCDAIVVGPDAVPPACEPACHRTAARSHGEAWRVRSEASVLDAHGVPSLPFVNWSMEPSVLARHLPRGLEPDVRNGRAFLSVVIADLEAMRPGFRCARSATISRRWCTARSSKRPTANAACTSCARTPTTGRWARRATCSPTFTFTSPTRFGTAAIASPSSTLPSSRRGAARGRPSPRPRARAGYRRPRSSLRARRRARRTPTSRRSARSSRARAPTAQRSAPSFDLRGGGSLAMPAASRFAGDDVREAQRFFVELYAAFNAYADAWTAVRIDRTRWHVVALEHGPLAEYELMTDSARASRRASASWTRGVLRARCGRALPPRIPLPTARALSSAEAAHNSRALLRSARLPLASARAVGVHGTRGRARARPRARAHDDALLRRRVSRLLARGRAVPPPRAAKLAAAVRRYQRARRRRRRRRGGRSRPRLWRHPRRGARARARD